MTIPYPINVLEAVSKKYTHDKEVIVGAGTVIDGETCRACILAGAIHRQPLLFKKK